MSYDDGDLALVVQLDRTLASEAGNGSSNLPEGTKIYMIFKKNVPLAPFSTFKIGGRAEYFFKISKPESLIKVIKWAEDKKIPWKIFAGGSNIIFPDKKIKGLLIQFSGGAIKLKNQKMEADAGVSLSAVVKKSIQAGLRGLETLSGIPGTLGGAIYGNAGAYGHSISEIVEKIEIWEPELRQKGQGKKRWLKNEECGFDYRESIFKERPYILLRAVLKFKKGGKEKLQKISREIIKIREKKYKPGLRCPGSFFKNVPVKKISRKSLKLINKAKIIEGKIPTGYLLEEVGAKGMRMGGIEIADFHGNLFVNRGNGTAKEAKHLADILKRRVRKKFGIELEEEVRYF